MALVTLLSLVVLCVHNCDDHGLLDLVALLTCEIIILPALLALSWRPFNVKILGAIEVRMKTSFLVIENEQNGIQLWQV